MDRELFLDIDAHLLDDERPSGYIESLEQAGKLSDYPFSFISRLKSTPQSKEHHPEGNVWNHTLMVVDEAAKVKNQSLNARVFMWAALLHDLGKATTTMRRQGRITAYDHDKAGAALAREFLGRFSEDMAFIDAVVALVRWHMQILFVVKRLPYADVRGMKREANVGEVALLGLCDRLGRKGADEAAEERNVLEFLRAVVD